MILYINYFNEFIDSQSIFWFCALAGTGILLIQLTLNILMGTGDLDNLDVGHGPISEASHEYDPNRTEITKFKWISIQTISGFLMMFGWTAITCQEEFGFSGFDTLFISIAAGLCATWILSIVLKQVKKCHSTGSVFKLEDSIGKDAIIYQKISQNGVGKVSIALENITHEIDAVSYNSKEIVSFTNVRIIEVIDDRTVVVKPI